MKWLLFIFIAALLTWGTYEFGQWFTGDAKPGIPTATPAPTVETLIETIFPLGRWRFACDGETVSRLDQRNSRLDFDFHGIGTSFYVSVARETADGDIRYDRVEVLEHGETAEVVFGDWNVSLGLDADGMPRIEVGCSDAIDVLRLEMFER